MGKGILRKYKERFDMEYKVWHEAREVVGEDVIRVMTAKFNSLILEHLNTFDKEGSVHNGWLL